MASGSERAFSADEEDAIAWAMICKRCKGDCRFCMGHVGSLDGRDDLWREAERRMEAERG